MIGIVTYVCPKCGDSPLRSVRATIKWDISLQLWVHDQSVNGCEIWCSKCHVRHDIEVERPLNFKEIAQAAINKQEATQ